jgi:hypothetical protein
MRIIKFGNIIHIDCHLTIPSYFTSQQAHEELKAIEELINQKTSSSVELFIHIDPCISSCCKLCQMNNCKIRQSPFEKRIEWNLENVMRNMKHGL